MNPKELKIKLIEREIKATTIAADLGVSKQSVWQVINRQSKSRRIAAAIANALGVSLESAFPEYAKQP